jgi:hypothetical protein
MIKHDHENESSQTISARNKSESHFSDHISHFETRRKTRYQHILASNSSQYSLQQAKSHQKKLTDSYSSQQWFVHRISSNRAKERDCCEQKLIIVMFSKKREIKTLKTKRLFSFIIACYSKSLNTIQSFREAKKRNRLTLKDFHYIFQNVIAARQKDLELDFDYNSLSFKLSSSVISNQFSRKSTLDSLSDIDLFDLKVRSSFSLRSLNRSFDRHVSLEQFVSFVNSLRIQSSRSLSSRSYEKKYQNDLFIRDNATERFFRVSNMTERNEKSTNSYESLTLRRDRECRVSRFSRFDFSHFRKASQDQDRQSQSCDDHEKSTEMQR